MKRVIDGLLFNTETAKKIASYSNGLGSNDFRAIQEGLYKTKKGNYFLAGEGGALTRYAGGDGINNYWDGENIFPKSQEEAFEWCQERGINADIIADEFPDLIVEA